MIKLLLLLQFTFVLHATQVSSILDNHGQLLDDKIGEYISWVEPFIKQYPTRFDSEDTYKRVNLSTLLIVGEIKTLNLKHVSAKAKFKLGHILAMAYNLELVSGELTKKYFESGLQELPNDPEGNYLFGMFLASTRAYNDKSLPYLEKALELGVKDAQFTIGLILVQNGKTSEGLKLLKEYSVENKTNDHVKKIIESIENKSLQFKQN